MSAQVTTRERPILFSAEMVRALLAGRKTQTRRVVNPQPTAVHGQGGNYAASYHPDGDGGKSLICPYGQPGDRLWVRETYLIAHVDHLHSIPNTRPDWMDSIGKYLLYGADGDCCRQIPECQCASVGKLPWRPSIHMPRWASRLTLEVTGVRIERLQDISEADAIAEGIEEMPEPIGKRHWRNYLRGARAGIDGEWTSDAGDSYAQLWESINGPGSWAANPFVWVVEFKIVEGGSNA